MKSKPLFFRYIEYAPTGRTEIFPKSRFLHRYTVPNFGHLKISEPSPQGQIEVDPRIQSLLGDGKQGAFGVEFPPLRRE